MSTGVPAYPPADTWVAAVHSSEGDFEPLGAAVVVDTTRVLTCAHVVTSSDGTVRQPLWVAFPKADECPRRRVMAVTQVYSPPVRDLAVLILEEPVPPGVWVAPLRCPRPADLVRRVWWAFGFPNRDPVGNSADGVVGTSLGYGWVRLDTNSPYPVEPGFSGAGLWSRDYAAVVGLVGQAHGNGDGRAITLHQADLTFPDQKLAVLASWSADAAGEVALQQWGWTLARDPEGTRHWRPRARGVSIESELGYRFRGRTVALSRLVAWLDRPRPDGRVLVVTGSPGVGKSAVLGRVVTTADATFRASLPADDESVRATLGAVSCAVHAKAKTALEVAEEIARAASARLPEHEGDLAPAVHEVLGDYVVSRRFNLIIDALDEAASPIEARRIIDRIVLPLAGTCSDVGVQVIVGTRRHDGGGGLLDQFGDALAAIDLDDPEYFAVEDLAAYVLACLQLAGDERPANPYADNVIATRLADRIANMSGQNFLVAGLVARTHGLYDREPVTAETLTFPTTVDAALAAYLERLSPVAGLSASRVLTALAFAEAPGLPTALWQVAAEAIEGGHIKAEDLSQFARSSAANFLIETGEAAEIANSRSAPVYRLFHQALNDALLSARSLIKPRTEDERILTLAFTRHGQQSKWIDSPPYLLRSLPSHAEAAGMVSDLLNDDAYLLHVDLRRLVPIAGQPDSEQARHRARLLYLTPEAITAGPEERAALFSVTETLENLGTSYRDGDWKSPYRGLWASVTPRNERATLDGHRGWVRGVCRLTVAGQELLASGGRDGTVRVWDPQTGEQRAVLEGHQGRAYGVCPVDVSGQQLLASAGGDGTVRVWDPQTGEQRAVLEGHEGRVNGICPVIVAGHQLLASAGQDATVRVWDPQTADLRTVLRGHRGAVRGICPVSVVGQQLLASAGADGTVRIWDPQTGEQYAIFEGHPSAVTAVCPVTVAGQQLLASAGADGTVRLWDPQSANQHTILRGHRGGIYAVCPVTVAGQQLLASAGADGTVRLWDPQTGERHAILRGHQGAVNAVCQVTVVGQQLLASAGADGTVRVWDPQTSKQHTILQGHRGSVRGVCPVTVAGQELLASGGRDGTVRVWDPQTGEQRTVLRGHQGTIRSLCPVTVAGRQLLASAGRAVRIWDPQTGERHAILRGHRGSVRGVCPVTVAGQQLLASAGSDGTVRIWDPRTGEQRAVLEGHQGRAYGVSAVTVTGQELLASVSTDRTVRIWDPRTGEQRAVLEGHQGTVTSVCPVTVAGQELLASVSTDRTVRIWDPQIGEGIATIRGQQDWVWGICRLNLDGQELIASAGADGTARIWDPQTGEQRSVLKGHQDRVNGVCPINVAGQQLLASASNDRTVRIWDPRTGEQRSVLEGHQGTVTAACPVTVAGQELLASASNDRTVRIWDPRTGEQRSVLEGHQDRVSGVCPVTVAGQQLLASAGQDGTVRIWDPQTGEQRSVLEGHQDRVSGVCPVTVAGQQLLASAGRDRTVRIWDPQTGEQRSVLEGHQGTVTAVCPVTLGGQQLLASASTDRTVRIWDARTGLPMLTMPTHHVTVAVAWVAESLALGLATGILVAKLAPGEKQGPREPIAP
jgi:WD40 repeat protein